MKQLASWRYLVAVPAFVLACGDSQNQGQNASATTTSVTTTGSTTTSSSSGMGGASSSSSAGVGGAGGGQTQPLCADSVGPDNAMLDAEAAKLLQDNHHAGMAFCAIRKGKVTWCRGYGKANIANDVAVTARTPFLLASISKLFAATALMQINEEGLFGLDDDVNATTPFSVVNPNTTVPITYRSLLAHTSSIVDTNAIYQWYTYGSDSPVSLYDILEDYLDPKGKHYSINNWSTSPPESKYDYTNMGYALVGLLSQLHKKKDFADLTKETIFDPLGMKDSAWRLADHDKAKLAMPYKWDGNNYVAQDHYTFPDYPNGGLRASACDLALFLASQANGGAPLLKAATLQEMLKPTYPSVNKKRGLGWDSINIGGEPWLGHSGGEKGVFTEAYFRPSDGVGFIMLTNTGGDDVQAVYAMEDRVIAWAETL